jgi:ABC-type transport system involved in cytochrome c biogenesis permease subunit
MLIVSASLLPKDASMKLVPALHSYWLQIHVSVAAFGEAAFAVGFAANIMYLLKKWLPENSAFGNRLPDLKKLDLVSYKAITVGYPALHRRRALRRRDLGGAGLGDFLELGPQRGRIARGLARVHGIPPRPPRARLDRYTRAVVLSSIGFICTLLTFFANLVLGGLHAYGVNG